MLKLSLSTFFQRHLLTGIQKVFYANKLRRKPDMALYSSLVQSAVEWAGTMAKVRMHSVGTYL